MLSQRYESVLMLLSNPATYDIRPLKEAKTLAKNGYRVIILAWDREGTSPKQSSFGNLLIHRFNLKAPYGQHIRTIVSLFVFYIWCIVISFTLKFKIIHCHDVDMFICGLLIKILKFGKVKLIYDMHDHPIVFLNKFPKYNILVKIIFAMAKNYADNIIVVNEGFMNYLLKIGFKREKMAIIMNVPSFASKVPTNKEPLKEEFLIFYYGDISAHRGVQKLIEAIIGLENVKLLIAGRGDLVYTIKKIEEKYKNIKYLGWISPSEINRLLKKVDLIPSIYIPDNINHILASPGKLFTAMANGIPVLVPEGSYQAKITKKYNCGIVVNINDIDEIKKAILHLASNPNLCKILGKNGIKAVNEVFNWSVMERRLLDMYFSLLSSIN